MKSCFGVGRRGHSSLKSAGAISLLFSAFALAGCSADVTRFDSTSFNFNDPPETSSAPPIPREPIRSGSLNDDSPVVGARPRGPYGAGASSVEVAALPETAANSYTPPPSPPSHQAKPFGSPRPEPSYGSNSATVAHTPASASSSAKGELIEVKPGDTLYGLSRRHHVSLAELTALNGLSNPNLKPGQKLYLPAGVSASPSSIAAEKAVESATPAPAPLEPPPADVIARYGATYTVRPGDSLYSVARTYKVKFAELQQVNGIADPRRVKPGVVLKVPGDKSEAHSAPAAAPSNSAPANVATAPNDPIVPPITPDSSVSEPSRYGQATTMQPTVINGGRRVASLSDKATDATPDPGPAKPEQKVAIAAPPATPQVPEVADRVKLRWPANGKIIAGFGGRPDGTHNDGVNLSVPLGTEVHAAESGVVAYAGSELKGYGNLVLLRHDNGWVTAYAHNDELLVKRGDKVKRGDVIAKAGKTGSVDQPQVHFELRQGSKPVDPIPYLEKL
jgi:murein DD-endopeptidase MepM/ murein hydrolase activator NlpD